jgi:hypothetical protein
MARENRTERLSCAAWPVLLHSARTAVVAVVPLLVARLFWLPEAYWAPTTTLVITQSSLGAALAVSGQPFVGTALGAVVEAIAASYFGLRLLVFGFSVFFLGLLCALVRSERRAFRFGGETLAVVLLVPLGAANRACVASRVFIGLPKCR